MKRMVVIASTLLISVALLMPSDCFAHPGSTDSNGGHWNQTMGEYHYHHGYPEHQHPNGICPYKSTATPTPRVRNDSTQTTKTTTYQNWKKSTKITAAPTPEPKKQNQEKPKSSPIIPLGAAAVAGGAVYSIGKKKRKEKLRQSQQLRMEQEQEQIRKKQAFIDSLAGRSIRDAAGVPTNITIVNDLPKDNDSSKYGSYTVYRSHSGKCYHKKKGCCSATVETHLFVAMQYFYRCSKCCKTQDTIPQWYSKYVELQKQAKEVGINKS